MPLLPIEEVTFDYPDNINRLNVLRDPDEGLTGMVQDKPASDIEERFARSLDKFGIQYDFQVSYLAPRNMTGEYRLDFLVYVDGEQLPVAVDGEYSHKTESQKRKDVWKDDQFNKEKAGQFLPVKRVTYLDLDTQELADEYVKEQILWLR